MNSLLLTILKNPSKKTLQSKILLWNKKKKHYIFYLNLTHENFQKKFKSQMQTKGAHKVLFRRSQPDIVKEKYINNTYGYTFSTVGFSASSSSRTKGSFDIFPDLINANLSRTPTNYSRADTFDTRGLWVSPFLIRPDAPS